MAMREEKRQTCVICGPRELQILEKKDELIAEKKLEPISKNEVFLRSLHCWRYLMEVDEIELLVLLAESLRIAVKNPTPNQVGMSKNLGFVILATMISKRGILKSESFDTIPMNLMSLHALVKTNEHKNKVPSEIPRALDELETSVNTVFLKKLNIDRKNNSELICRYRDVTTK